MRVTILADASYCDVYKAAGYGFWAVSERGRQGGGGPMRGAIHSSHVAEMMAVVNALAAAAKIGIVMEGDEVLVQSDCIGAMRTLERPANSRGVTLPVQEKPVWDKFDEIKKRLNLKVKFKHVKAHTNSTEKRFVANRMCDMRAKKGMRAARAEAIRLAEAQLA